MIYDLHPLFLPLFLPHPLRLIRNGNSDIALPTLDGRYWDIMFLFPGRDCWYAPCLAFSHSRMVMFWTVWRLSCLRLVTRFSASKTIWDKLVGWPLTYLPSWILYTFSCVGGGCVSLCMFRPVLVEDALCGRFWGCWRLWQLNDLVGFIVALAAVKVNTAMHIEKIYRLD